MNTTDLSELLRGATAGVEPPEGFTEQVLQGGRRRRFRRRITMAASAVMVAAVAVAGTFVAGQDNAIPPVSDQRLTTPTKGDLAGDQAFLDEVTEVWRTDLPYSQENRLRFYDDPRGEPHVLWAGNTPAGRAAVVVQQIYIHEDYWVTAGKAGPRIAEGLIGIDPADGKLKLLGTRPPHDEIVPADAYMFGPDDRTLLMVDEGEPLYYAADTTGDPESFRRPNWQRVQPRDGVVLMTIPDTVMNVHAYQGDHPPEAIDFAVVQPSRAHLDHLLSGPNDRIPVPNFFRWKDTWTFGTPVEGVSLNRLQFTVDDRIHSAWQITVWLPGRVFVVKETMIDGEKSQFDSNGSVLVAGSATIELDALGDVAMVDIERVNHRAVLPIKYRIPDGGGWVVAQKGKPLAYRLTPDGQWQDAGKDAALLPDNAVEVQVGEDVVTL